jgi:hypothetical protein
MKYGLYDNQGKCWLGNEDGPKTFDDFMLARVAAQIVEDQITGSDLGCRIEAKELPEDSWKFKDTVSLKHSTLESLQRIEGSTDRTEDEEKQRQVEMKLDDTPHLPFWKEIN